ncbi:MAG: hypothetical protein KC620_05480 [Myxococcales bacterium]|nr:hypothetical protein [Myxococcales bacterium]
MRRAIIVSWLLLWAQSARAVPALELLGGARPDRAFGGRSTPIGAQSAYFNPAFLPGTPGGAELTFVALDQSLQLDLFARPEGYDVPEDVYRARQRTDEGTTARLTDRPLPTGRLRNPRGSDDPDAFNQFVVFGTTLPLWADRLTLGFVAVLPVGVFQRQAPFYSDAREQAFSNSLHFELLGDRLDLTPFTLGMGFRPLPHLSVGLGATLINHADSRPAIYVPDAADQETATTNAAVDVSVALAPHFGVVIRPLADERLRLTATAHLASESAVSGRSALQFWDYEYPEGQTALYQPFRQVFAHEPLRVGFGASGRLPSLPIEVHVDGLWTRWSAYHDRHDEVPDDFADTLGVQGGVDLDIDDLSVSFGMNYAPTPVPEQTGRTNYVDNARLGAQVGGRYVMPFEGWHLAVGAGFQAQRLLARDHFKRTDAARPVVDEFPDSVDANTGAPIASSAGVQTNNPGFPGFHSEGWLLAALVRLEVFR